MEIVKGSRKGVKGSRIKERNIALLTAKKRDFVPKAGGIGSENKGAQRIKIDRKIAGIRAIVKTYLIAKSCQLGK